MFCIKRALAVLIVCMLVKPVCAFTFSYGNLFEVKKVVNKNGVLQLPLTRKKYKNVKILSRELYSFLRACQTDCSYAVSQEQFEIEEIRPAATNTQMFIIEVSFNRAVLLTFLGFKNKNGMKIVFPQEVIWKDAGLKKRVQKYLEDQVKQNV